MYKSKSCGCVSSHKLFFFHAFAMRLCRLIGGEIFLRVYWKETENQNVICYCCHHCCFFAVNCLEWENGTDFSFSVKSWKFILSSDMFLWQVGKTEWIFSYFEGFSMKICCWVDNLTSPCTNTMITAWFSSLPAFFLAPIHSKVSDGRFKLLVQKANWRFPY